MTEGGFFMKKDRKQAAAALIAAAWVIAAGAFAPVQPRAAWWCTAFSVAPAEAVDSRTAEHDSVEYRFWLADWLRTLWE